jgi:hypothetical protein
LFGCETASVKAAGSWRRQVEVGASGNVNGKKNYKKLQTSETSERHLYKIAQKEHHSDHAVMKEFTDNDPDYERSCKPKRRVLEMLPATGKTQENPIISWREHHEEAEVRGRPTARSLIWCRISGSDFHKTILNKRLLMLCLYLYFYLFTFT